MATLTITNGHETQIGKSFILKQRPLAGGRHPSMEIQLLDPEVSRRHFLIRFEDDRHLLTETHSANGVFVNGQQIREHCLQEGDQIQVGKTVLVYSRKDDQASGDALQDQRRGERQIRELGTVLIRHDPIPPPRQK
jgi:pSer/pThr/pTyr-binding forkhead associated (FHA) protein